MSLRKDPCVWDTHEGNSPLEVSWQASHWQISIAAANMTREREPGWMITLICSRLLLFSYFNSWRTQISCIFQAKEQLFGKDFDPQAGMQHWSRKLITTSQSTLCVCKSWGWCNIPAHKPTEVPGRACAASLGFSGGRKRPEPSFAGLTEGNLLVSSDFPSVSIPTTASLPSAEAQLRWQQALRPQAGRYHLAQSYQQGTSMTAKSEMRFAV